MLYTRCALPAGPTLVSYFINQECEKVDRSECFHVFLSIGSFNIYRPQIRFRKGIVFTGICLFTDGGGVGGLTSNESRNRLHGRVHPRKGKVGSPDENFQKF